MCIFVNIYAHKFIPTNHTTRFLPIALFKKCYIITRDIEIKNNLTVIKGEVGDDNGREGGSVFRNNYKGHMDKTKGRALEVGDIWGGLGGVVGRKCRQLYLNNNKIIIKS